MNGNHVLRKSFVVGIILLFLGTCLIRTIAQEIGKPVVLAKGHILYVGGVGPNNYTKIQDAIDNTTDGDTVFVFDDSSPYTENIVISTSISLVGEEKNTTVIDGASKGNGVNITADNVMVQGFTIKNCNESGIYLSSNNNTIMGNILSNDLYGITNTDLRNISFPVSGKGYNTITNNLIIGDGGGIFFIGEQNSIISRNSISQTEFGITLLATVNNNISFNIISENNFSVGVGVFLTAAYNTMIYRNNISHNGLGVWTLITSADHILQNNFIGNNRSALSNQRFIGKIRMLKMQLHLPLRHNVWNGNYWDGPRVMPYIIPGVFLKFTLQIDWRPAQEPYEIPG
jgi:parallel beta-helix repeat protein